MKDEQPYKFKWITFLILLIAWPLAIIYVLYYIIRRYQEND